MNKKLLIILAVIVLVGGGAAAYVLTRSDEPSNVTSNNENNNRSAEQSIDETPAEGTSASLRSLFGDSKNQVCSYSDQENSGTVYIAGDKRLRVDYKSTDPDQGEGSMIMNSQNIYFWEEASKEGFSMPYQEPDTAHDHSHSDTSDEGIGDVDVDHEYDFSCEDWNVDNAKFTPPTDVNFIDMSQLMQMQP